MTENKYKDNDKYIINKYNIEQMRLRSAISECEKHILKINHAISRMESFMPLTPDKLNSLSEDDKEHIDQLIFRYSKLQDVMGEKLFPSVLINLKEDIEKKPFRDILNRLEKLEIIENADVWIELRNGRNILSHEYSSENNELSNNINEIFYKNTPDIFSIYYKIFEYFKKNIF